MANNNNDAKYKVDEEKEILVTSYFKAVSDRKYQKMNAGSFYKFEQAALKLNGIDPKIKMKRKRIHDPKYFGASFDYENDTFKALNNTLVKFDYSIGGNGFGFKVHIFNLKTGEEFSSEEIKDALAYAKDDDGEGFDNFDKSLDYYQHFAEHQTEESKQEEKPELSSEFLLGMLKDYGKFDTQNSDSKMCFYKADYEYLIRKCNLPYTVEELHEAYKAAQKHTYHFYGRECDLCIVKPENSELRIIL